MTGRSCLLAALGAAGIAHLLPYTPSLVDWLWLAAGLFAVSLLCLGLWRRNGMRLAMPLWAFAIGLLWVSVHIDHRLSDSLSLQDEDRVTRVVLRIASLVRVYPDSRQFEAEVISSRPPGIPGRIRVSWHGADYAGPYKKKSADTTEFPELIPGQVWRMSLNLRRPHGPSNPHGFDYEGHLFAQGLRAVGSVRGTPRYMHNEPWANLTVVAERARHYVREAMAPYIQGRRYGAVLLALTIGDQASMQPEDWQVFNRTSTSHAIAISGSHITMIAAMGGLFTLWLWRRLSWRGFPLAERLPAQVAACLAALLVAWLYCLLAGWGVPARRTFLMLAVLAAAHLSRLSLGAWRVLLLAAVAVVVMDPWALMATGFWLSFGAVAVLLTSAAWFGRSMATQAAPARVRMCRWFWAACMLQLTVTAGLLPILALLFNEVSLVSPLANAYVIPIISLVVTPLALLLAGIVMLPGLGWLAGLVSWLAYEPLEIMMVPTRWLAGLEAASLDAAAAPAWAILLAVTGMAAALMPRGLPWRHAGWLLMLPALLWRPDRPPEGGWDMVALDVGQGASTLVVTARHALLFDTGVRHGPSTDAASRHIVPLLRAKGIKHLDVLVVSHADIDHAGGMRSLLEARRVVQSYSSFDAEAYLRREAALLGASPDTVLLPQVMSPCRYGATWHVDGVSFEFMWPLARHKHARDRRASRDRNAQSCVLRIRGKHHTALLTGDIAAAQEDELVMRSLGRIDVLTAAHHGSRTSSSQAFVAHTAAKHAIAQAGRWNRYGHPHPAVQRRWEEAGTQFWRTDQHGAISVRSRHDGLLVESHRQSRQRHWNRG